MTRLLASLRSAVLPNPGASPNRTRRVGALTAGIGAVALVGGLLQTASASSISLGLIDTSTKVESLSIDNKSVVGEKVTYKATVTPDVGTDVPTGKVTFKENDENGVPQAIPQCTERDLDGGSATCEQTYVVTGSHTITAHFTDPNSIFNSSTSPDSVTQTVDAADTLTSVISAGSTVTGQEATFTASVSAIAPGSGTPSGSVTFSEGTNDLCTKSLSVSGTAECKTSSLPASGSPYSIKAAFTPDNGNYNSSDGSVQQVVDAADTTTQVVSNKSSTVTGESVTFTATVGVTLPGLGTPSGTVTFNDGTNDIGPCTLVPLSSGQCTTSFPASTNQYSVKATFTPDDGQFNSSFGSVLHTVNAAQTQTAVVSSDDTTVKGELVTFTATVSAVSPGSGTPTGSVSFSEGATSLCSSVALVAVNGSQQASCPTSALAVGGHSIQAAFTPDDGLFKTSSNSVTQTVDKLGTGTGVSSSDSSVKAGELVTFTAVVTPNAGATIPTGNVEFKDGSVDIPGCSAVPLSVSGSATCAHTFGSSDVGSHQIKAVYLGDSNFKGSESAAIPQDIGLGYNVSTSVATATSGKLCCGPTQATFKISRLSVIPAIKYQLCVKYADAWPAVTPPPKNGATQYTLNRNDKCKIEDANWSSSSADSIGMWPTFGFATKGTYAVTWKTTTGDLIGAATFEWTSWCPPAPNGYSSRQLGVWRTSRHKVVTSCSTTSGKVYKGRASPNHLDGDEEWGFTDNHGQLHMEFVKRDYSTSYGAPSNGALGNMKPSGNVTTAGVYLCDTYHGHDEKHPIFMVQDGSKIYISGPQYSTKIPSVSGTWSAHGC